MNIAKSPTSSAKWALSSFGSGELHGPAMHRGPSKDPWLPLHHSPFQSLPLQMPQLLRPIPLLFAHTSSLCHSDRVRHKKMVVREIQEGKEDNRILEVEMKGREISSWEMHKFLDLPSNRTHYLNTWYII